MFSRYLIAISFFSLTIIADAPVDNNISSGSTSDEVLASGAEVESKPVSVSAYESEGSIGSSNGIEEVVVTASKKEESLQESPIAITAITESTIEDLNITSLTDIRSMALI